MKLVIKVQDAVTLARRFKESPREAMQSLVVRLREELATTLERVMESELELFLGEPGEATNKRNGFRERTFVIKGLGEVRVRVPRDRAGRFTSAVVPAGKRYDAAIEKDLALLQLAGLSTRMLSQLSGRVLGMKVSSQEVSNALATLVPAARRFLERPIGDRRWKYLYIDGTNFRVRRTTVDLEPTLVVLGVDEDGYKSVLSMVQGDKDSRPAWEMVFSDLKARGLEGAAVQLGIMDGLPGLAAAFVEAFPKAKAARCWVHKARNVLPRVPKRYQADFQPAWDAMQYAAGRKAAKAAFDALATRWRPSCGDAVACIERDLEALLVHYDFPQPHWEALRTTNPIERVNKEFKRRSKAMEQMGADGLKTILAFTALRLEFGWSITPITSNKLANLPYREQQSNRLAELEKSLIH
jgi:putative transposase